MKLRYSWSTFSFLSSHKSALFLDVSCVQSGRMTLFCKSSFLTLGNLSVFNEILLPPSESFGK